METERKFLVANNSFADGAFQAKRIVQGYICADTERSVRVRISDREGFLTIKSETNDRGWSRYEFEQPIALQDAEELMKLCLPGLIDKMRHYVKVGGHIWEVDVFHGKNEGLVVAEIELESEDEVFDLPSWIDREVSGDPKYYNLMLARHPYTTWNTFL
ncbi:MAG: CYTH domain-containing protein [Tannerella sp.]|jgi:CYTH domain-containing protein|nr:CYTH domain-containing protein [Tannerella sp.]